MSEKRIIEIFTESGALLTGHFKLTSGLHSNRYFQCAMVLQYPHFAEELCRIAKTQFAGKEPSAVIAPAVGGIVVGQETARQLNCRSIFAERQDGKMVLRRGFSVQPGDSILVAEDVVTTGGSVKEVIDLIEGLGASVIGIFAIVDRSGGQADFGAPFVSAMQMEVVAHQPDVCPLCAKGLPLTQPGSGGLQV
ncbi:MAG: orotate phosphoribosyltransferase [bacterium]